MTLASLRAHAAPTIRWLAETTPPSVEVEGVTPQTGATLEVFAEFVEGKGAASVTLPPMAGTRTWLDGRWRFTPQFPLARGVRYRAELRLPGAAPVVAHFALPADTTPASTRVVEIYPTVDVLPENQLKFYVQFSAPMSRGSIYEHIAILGRDGRAIDLPFLVLDEELWDPTMTRVTLLIDPGRIKRGVKPLEDVGPVFEMGKTYSLTIDAAWRDAAGRPLVAAFRKKFRVAAADRTPPSPARWTVRAPSSGSREPLVVNFDEPMDRALALRLISVITAAGAPVEGEPALDEREKRWSFVPARLWSRGAHRLAIATTIEDLAGNNIGKTFDEDAFEAVPHRIDNTTELLPFEVK